MPPKVNSQQTLPSFGNKDDIVMAYVYIATNPLLTNMLKIGFSKQDPKIRIRDFQRAALPKSYFLEWYIHVESKAKTLEKKAHESLKAHNIQSDDGCGKEWFYCSLHEATTCIKELCEELNIAIKEERKLSKNKPMKQTKQNHLFDASELPAINENQISPIKPVVAEESIQSVKEIAPQKLQQSRAEENKSLLLKKFRAGGLEFETMQKIKKQIENGELAICDCQRVNKRPYPNALRPFNCDQCTRLIER